MANKPVQKTGTLTGDLGNFPAGTSVTYVTTVDDEGAVNVILKAADKEWAGQYSDQAVYKSKFLSIINPVESAEVAVDRILEGADVRDILVEETELVYEIQKSEVEDALKAGKFKAGTDYEVIKHEPGKWVAIRIDDVKMKPKIVSALKKAGFDWKITQGKDTFNLIIK